MIQLQNLPHLQIPDILFYPYLHAVNIDFRLTS
jgi:hypothetical protein